MILASSLRATLLLVFSYWTSLPGSSSLGFPWFERLQDVSGKESACSARDLGLIPGLGRSPGEGKGYPLQYSALENSVDCIVHGLQRVRHDWATFTFRMSLASFKPGAGMEIHVLDRNLSVLSVGPLEFPDCCPTQSGNLLDFLLCF